jgi:hypothetical protein
MGKEPFVSRNNVIDVGPDAVNEAVDAAAVAVMDADDSKEKAKAAEKKKKKKLAAARKLLAEIEKNDAPRRRQHSRAFIESIQNGMTY